MSRLYHVRHSRFPNLLLTAMLYRHLTWPHSKVRFLVLFFLRVKNKGVDEDCIAIKNSYLFQEPMVKKKKQNKTKQKKQKIKNLEQWLAFHEIECGPPGSKPFVGCVCWFFTLLQEVFRLLQFLPLNKNWYFMVWAHLIWLIVSAPKSANQLHKSLLL